MTDLIKNMKVVKNLVVFFLIQNVEVLLAFLLLRLRTCILSRVYVIWINAKQLGSCIKVSQDQTVVPVFLKCIPNFGPSTIRILQIASVADPIPIADWRIFFLAFLTIKQ